MKNLFFVVAALVVLIGCKSQPENAADSIYFGGDIITMEGDSPQYAEAVAVKAGKLLFVGSKDEAMKFKGSETKLVNLQGKTLMPGFFDAHCHFGSFSLQALGANVLPPPDGKVNNITDIISTLKKWATPENMALTGWIFGSGYDDSQLEEKRHPTKQELDQVSTEVPIIIIHISGHFCAMNSKALQTLGIDKNSKDPDGGTIRRMPNSTEPNGVLEELAAIPLYSKIFIPQSKEASLKFITAGQDMALSYGYTTAVEGRAMDQSLNKLADENFFKIDVLEFVDYSHPEFMSSDYYSKDYKNHFRILGMKVTLDGSPQGRTAWRTIPYILPPPGEDADYKGYPAFPDEKLLTEIFENAFKNNWKVEVHANGDAAIDQMIRTMKPGLEKYGNTDRRNALIHGQYVRPDQLDTLKKMDVIVSLFPMHTFYWGDWHKEIIGDELGNKISPTRTALNKGLKLTTHTDAPIALPNLMVMVWAAVNRVSRTGQIIGEDEKLTPYEALKSITEWAAYQHFEESKKGTLTVNKLADMVVLDQNPLKVDPMKIKDIIVLETIKEGQSVYTRK